MKTLKPLENPCRNPKPRSLNTDTLNKAYTGNLNSHTEPYKPSCDPKAKRHTGCHGGRGCEASGNLALTVDVAAPADDLHGLSMGVAKGSIRVYGA